MSARSRRKLGGVTATTAFAGFAGTSCDLSRIMTGIVRKRARRRNRELGTIPAIQYCPCCLSIR
jgi:hypothetical protein